MIKTKKLFTLSTILYSLFFFAFFYSYLFAFRNDVSYALLEPFLTLGNFIVNNVLEIVSLVLMYVILVFLFAQALIHMFVKKSIFLKLSNVITFVLGFFVALYSIHGFKEFNIMQSAQNCSLCFASHNLEQGTFLVFVYCFGPLTLLFLVFANWASDFVIPQKVTNLSKEITEKSIVPLKPAITKAVAMSSVSDVPVKNSDIQTKANNPVPLMSTFASLNFNLNKESSTPQKMITIYSTNLPKAQYLSNSNLNYPINQVFSSIPAPCIPQIYIKNTSWRVY